MRIRIFAMRKISRDVNKDLSQGISFALEFNWQIESTSRRRWSKFSVDRHIIFLYKNKKIHFNYRTLLLLQRDSALISSLREEIRFAEFFIYVLNRRVATRQRRDGNIVLIARLTNTFSDYTTIYVFAPAIKKKIPERVSRIQLRFRTRVSHIWTINKTDRRILTKILFLSVMINTHFFPTNFRRFLNELDSWTPV